MPKNKIAATSPCLEQFASCPKQMHVDTTCLDIYGGRIDRMNSMGTASNPSRTTRHLHQKKNQLPMIARAHGRLSTAMADVKYPACTVPRRLMSSTPSPAHRSAVVNLSEDRKPTSTSRTPPGPKEFTCGRRNLTSPGLSSPKADENQVGRLPADKTVVNLSETPSRRY